MSRAARFYAGVLLLVAAAAVGFSPLAMGAGSTITLPGGGGGAPSVSIYTTPGSGTWTRPAAGCSSVEWVAIGGGGGGIG